jgi:hypothetical protein
MNLEKEGKTGGGGEKIPNCTVILGRYAQSLDRTTILGTMAVSVECYRTRQKGALCI